VQVLRSRTLAIIFRASIERTDTMECESRLVDESDLSGRVGDDNTFGQLAENGRSLACARLSLGTSGTQRRFRVELWRHVGIGAKPANHVATLIEVWDNSREKRTEFSVRPL
jgi:hypothetical protein